jgi:hypothetical protein
VCDWFKFRCQIRPDHFIRRELYVEPVRLKLVSLDNGETTETRFDSEEMRTHNMHVLHIAVVLEEEVRSKTWAMVAHTCK